MSPLSADELQSRRRGAVEKTQRLSAAVVLSRQFLKYPTFRAANG
jgi:hypothetical protein